MKKTKLLFIAVTSLLLISLLTPAVIHAQFDEATNEACAGLQAGDDFIDCEEDGEGGSRINSILVVVLNVLSFVAGVIAVIMLIIAGIRFVTSSGEAQSISSARNTVIYAIIGIIIVALSQVLVRFVIGRADNIADSPTQSQQTDQPQPINCPIGQSCPQ